MKATEEALEEKQKFN
ncbi:hypothetical protein Taro_021762 [Colocasia esculenta]|uniref:Uncharacterized protein n=1 Tax=Colocasia esculenta TaxID=4460 RepID=A0A843UZN6_COLES|nr:hypothetical protein [Colocasia esculenta]